jgi:molybdenum cofactor cytidylyltransferase
MNVAAIVLAAGLSTRMGENKLLLPWQGKTVIHWVVEQVISSGVNNILLITGKDREKVENETYFNEVTHIFNPDYSDGEMLHSLQCGIRALPEDSESVLVILGDQPQLEINSINKILEYHDMHPQATLIVPSYQMRKGHPWLVGRSLWKSILDLKPPQNLKTFLNQHKHEINYVVVDSPTILNDLDTPEEYQNALKMYGNKNSKG